MYKEIIDFSNANDGCDNIYLCIRQTIGLGDVSGYFECGEVLSRLIEGFGGDTLPMMLSADRDF